MKKTLAGIGVTLALAGGAVLVADNAPTQEAPVEATLTKFDKEMTVSYQANDTDDVHVYQLSPRADLENGGMEFQIVLKERPNINRFCFTIGGADDLDFFYQDALTKQEIAEGIIRPENVVGSYAVYYKNHKDNAYKTGKAYQINRPPVTDANGASVLADLDYSPFLHQLCVVPPQSFLDAATYPVTL